jgi:CRP-like cAMP-binding protein
MADPAPRIRPLAEVNGLAERAAGMLRGPMGLVQLTPEEALLVATRMGLVVFPAGAKLLREGADSASGHMLLILEGEVSVDSQAGVDGDPLALSVLGPGDIIGEMALLDGAPRSANCTAISAVQAAGFSRKGLEQLMVDNPVVAAKLVAVMATRISDRLRALSQQVQMYAQLAAQHSDELNRLRSGR